MSPQVLKASNLSKGAPRKSGDAPKFDNAALPGEGLATMGMHHSMIQIGLGGVVWFLAVTWLYFVWGRHVDLDLAVAAGIFVMFFTLFLLLATRWAQEGWPTNRAFPSESFDCDSSLSAMRTQVSCCHRGRSAPPF